MTGAETGPSLGVEEEGAMSLIRRRRWVAGLILGLGPAGSSRAQDLPPAGVFIGREKHSPTSS